MNPPGVFVHHAALCESLHVGPGTRIWAFAHVLPGAVVGSDCNICDGAFIEDGARVGDRVTVKNGVLIWTGVTVGDDVFLGPGAVFTNDLRPRAHQRLAHEDLVPTVVDRGATIGANATIVCGTVIGAHAFVAAGAVVIDDVPPHCLVGGSPARRLGWVCECGAQLPGDRRCEACGALHVPQGDGLRRVEPAPDGQRSVSAPSGRLQRARR